MPPKMMSRPQRRRSVTITLWSLIAGVAVVSIWGVFGILSPIESGSKLLRDDTAHQADDLRESVKMLLTAYGDLTNVVTAAFGAIAFLVTYQQKQRIVIGTRAWTTLSAGLIFLTGALVLTLLGRESLLT